MACVAPGLRPLGQLPLAGTVAAVLPQQPPWEQDRHIPPERDAVKPDRRVAGECVATGSSERLPKRLQTMALGMDRSRLGNIWRGEDDSHSWVLEGTWAPLAVDVG